MAVGGRPATTHASPARRSLSGRLLVWWPVAPVALVYAASALIGFDPYVSTGDEPSYLLDALSLTRDLDRDVGNQYADPDQVAIASPFAVTSELQAYAYDDSGALRSIHGAGMGVILAPSVLLGLGLAGARATIVLIAICAAGLLLSVLRCLDLASTRATTLAWASVVLSLPLVSYGDQLYPEVPGLLLCLLSLRVVVSRDPPVSALVVAAASAGSLPWFNARFAPLALGLSLALLVRVLQRRHTKLRDLRTWPRVPLAAIGAPLLAQAAAYLYTNQRWYGSVSPSAAFEAVPFYTTSTSWPRVYDQALGNVFSPLYGWLPFAPVHVLGLVGVGLLVRRHGAWAWAALLTVLGYLAVIGSSGFGSVAFAFPARLHLVVIPCVAFPLAVFLTRGRAARVVFAGLMVLSAVLTVQGVADRGRLIPSDEVLGRGVVPLALNEFLAPVWPDYERQPEGVLTLSQADLLRTVGSVVPTPSGPQARSAPGEGSGALTYGPYRLLPDGAWRATFLLSSGPAAPDEVVAELKVVGNPPRLGTQDYTVLASRTVSRQDLRDESELTSFSLDFEATGDQQVQTVIRTTGASSLSASDVSLQFLPAEALTSFERAFPSAGLTAGWVVGLVIAGAAAVLTDTRGRRSSHRRPRVRTIRRQARRPAPARR